MNKKGYLSLLSLSMASCLVLTGCNDSDKSTETVMLPPALPLTDCMWHEGPTSKKGSGEDPRNYAYPDSNVNYWSSQFTVPEGAKVYIEGDYPYARHSSLVSYTATGERVNSIRDFELEPEKGVVNPFIVGNPRMNKERRYTAEIKIGEPPIQPEKNTLYIPKTDDNSAAVLYRVYVPNKGLDAKAGVEFPRFKVVLANGEIKTGADVCSTLNVKDEMIKNENAPPIYIDIYNKNKPHANVGYPARVEPKWFKAFNKADNFKCTFQLYQCEGQQPVSKLNQWATPDNEYMFVPTSREVNKVLVLRGKLPSTTKTYNNDKVVNDSDLRYWSICTNEMFTSATNYCLYDEQIKVDKNGYYTIVVANPEDRPSNANESCGVNYLEQSPRGDGYYKIPKNSPDYNAADDFGHTDLGMLIIRNLLPKPSFKQSLQYVTTWGDEKAILGDYAPDMTYTTKEAFEAEGCHSTAR